MARQEKSLKSVMQMEKMQLNKNTKLWGAGGFRENRYVRSNCLENVDSNWVILPLTRWLQIVEKIDGEILRKTGIFAEAGEDIKPLLPFLDVVSVIALNFPKFSDGRSYSTAMQLKQTYCYRGELRAVGDVLIDQVSNMLRCGFDTLEVKHQLTQIRLKEYSKEIFPGFYQPGARLIRTSSQNRIWRSTAVR
ncbi:MAG: hypothetical protein JSC188_000310 [Candidatus Tokpelaia sp. JSC188]|nr:MAG: hypothetical protein JSC188_000310 [Candidatus Tokpelaia sp. JSC188]